MTPEHVLAVMIRDHGALPAILAELRAMRSGSGGHCGESRMETAQRRAGDAAVDVAIASLEKVKEPRHD